ncbi:MAG: hypothetical protein DRN78_05070 [Thermoproteota archaeon]|nr:MAG: hypothetical protein DRN78_05070 [Candidatus Korarchaeota archaeon]
MTDLKQLLEELINIIKMTSDPFKVRVEEILEELSSALPEMESEDLQVDGEIISLLAKVVKEQEEWVKREASIAAIGKIIALLKIKALDSKGLAKELLENWNPIADLSQVTFAEVYLALSYLKSKREYELGERITQGFEVTMPEPGVDIKQLMDELEEELADILRRGKVPYGEVIRGKDVMDMLLRAYALSCLATMGKVTITYDPLQDEYYVERAGEGESYSQVVQLGRYVNAD